MGTHNYLVDRKRTFSLHDFLFSSSLSFSFFFFSYPFFILSHSTTIEDNAFVLLFSKYWTRMRESITLLLFWPKNRKVVAWFACWFLSREENPKAQAFFLGLIVLWLVWSKNDFWVLLSPILLSFLFSFDCFGRKTQRLMLGSFLSREENPKAETFLHGLAVVCLGWLENDFF